MKEKKGNNNNNSNNNNNIIIIIIIITKILRPIKNNVKKFLDRICNYMKVKK